MKNNTFNVVKALLYLGLCYGLIQIVILVPQPPSVSKYLWWGLLVSLFSWGLTHLFVKYEGKTAADYGLQRNPYFFKDILLGLFLGTLVLITMLTVLFTTTNLTAQPLPEYPIGRFLLEAIPVIFVLALMEELIFRGYALFKLKQYIGIRTSIYLTSILFGLYHGLSFDAAFGPAVFGLLFALMALWSKSLILPTVFHFTVNFIQAIFGMKPQYTMGLYELSLDENIKSLHVDTVGLMLSVCLAVVALILIEVYIKKSPAN